jgi:hypothetical protein
MEYAAIIALAFLFGQSFLMPRPPLRGAPRHVARPPIRLVPVPDPPTASIALPVTAILTVPQRTLVQR